MGKLYPVEQVDREAAGKLFARTSDEAASQARSGNWDLCTEVQAFARHRIEATPAVDREGVREAIAGILAPDRAVFFKGEPLLDKVDAIMALLPVKQSDGWQDISTAPKDGTLIDAWSNCGERVTDVKWCKRRERWVEWAMGGFDSMDWSPVSGRLTHWMPSPAPPAKGVVINPAENIDPATEKPLITAENSPPEGGALGLAERVRDGLEQIATASEDTEASVLRYIAKATLDALPPAIRSLDITRMDSDG